MVRVRPPSLQRFSDTKRERRPLLPARWEGGKQNARMFFLFICAFLVFAKGEANGRSTLHADLFCDPLHAVRYNDGGDGDGE